jgi:hypothetical protein
MLITESHTLQLLTDCGLLLDSSSAIHLCSAPIPIPDYLVDNRFLNAQYRTIFCRCSASRRTMKRSGLRDYEPILCE